MRVGIGIVACAVVFLSGCMTVIGDSDLLLPHAVTSAYFTTTTVGFSVDASREEIEAHYVIALAVVRSLPQGAFVECRFENPLDKNIPFVVTHKSMGNEKEIFLESPSVDGLQYHQVYEIVIEVYDSPQKGILLATHRQPITSMFQQASVERIDDQGAVNQ